MLLLNRPSGLSGVAGPGGGVAPTNTVAPVVTGTNIVGQTLSTTNGTWTGDATIVFTYQWQRNTVNIGSATASTYVLVAADSATSIRCVVTGTNSTAPAGTANSNAIVIAAAADFEAGVNGSNVLAADTASQAAWNVVSAAGSGNSIKYDTTHAYGTLSAKIDTSGTAGSLTLVEWTTAVGTVTDSYGRLYLYMTANPASGFRIMQDGANVNRIFITSAGKVQFWDAAASTTTTTSVALNQWVRIEWHLVNSATVGLVEIKLFNNPDSATVTETQTTAANRNTAASSTGFYFGNSTGATGGIYWLDNIVAGATAYPGPVAVGVSSFVREEDGTSKFTLEEGGGSLLLEESV